MQAHQFGAHDRLRFLDHGLGKCVRDHLAHLLDGILTAARP
jgi:hypothetical protein